MLQRLVARAPTRIDFGGGWTDVPPYPAEHEGFVCNVAITRYATATVTRGVDDRSVPLVSAALGRAGIDDAHVELESDYPVGAGLGGSSAAGVTLAGALAAWRGESLSRVDLAERSCTTERSDLGIAGGSQDHYAAAFGGALALRFRRGAIDVEPIALDASLRAELSRRCLVWFTGESRISAQQIQVVVDALGRGDPRVLGLLEGMKHCAMAAAEALRRGSLDDLGRIVGAHWALQRELHPNITTGTIDAIFRRAHAAGALGCKALGASGGGCVVVISRDDNADDLRRAIGDLATPLDYEVDSAGFTIVEGAPPGAVTA
jgi:D-glycero-alpha-D-manno-heptose-7-phosphate kinase